MSYALACKTDMKAALKAIRRILENYQPDVQCSVKEQDGQTIAIVTYTDGISRDKMREICRKYENQGFALYTAMKFSRVNIQREMSPKVKRLLMKEFYEVWPQYTHLSEKEYFPPMNVSVLEYIQGVFNSRSYNR